MRRTLRIVCLLIPVFLLNASAQVLISRRIYRQNGPSHHQIWNWNPATGTLRQLTHSARAHYQPACSPGGQTIHFVSPKAGAPEDWPLDARLWSFNRATGVERIASSKPFSQSASNPAQPDCPISARAGGLLACARGQDVVFSRNQSEIARIRVAKQEIRITRLSWSPSREWLLVDTFGQNSNSTYPQSDYYALDVVGRKVIAAGSGNYAVWVPGKTAILYVPPRVLTPLPGRTGHSVWVSHVVLFDLSTQKTTAITSGLTSDLDLSVCPIPRRPAH
jgi:hypothetical protein